MASQALDQRGVDIASDSAEVLLHLGLAVVLGQEFQTEAHAAMKVFVNVHHSRMAILAGRRVLVNHMPQRRLTKLRMPDTIAEVVTPDLLVVFLD